MAEPLICPPPNPGAPALEMLLVIIAIWLSCQVGPLSLWLSINFLLQLTRTEPTKLFWALGISILLSLCVDWGHCGCLALLMMNLKGREDRHLTTWTKAGKRGGMAPFSFAPLAWRRGKHLVNITYYSGVRTSCVLERYKTDLWIE